LFGNSWGGIAGGTGSTPWRTATRQRLGRLPNDRPFIALNGRTRTQTHIQLVRQVVGFSSFHAGWRVGAETARYENAKHFSITAPTDPSCVPLLLCTARTRTQAPTPTPRQVIRHPCILKAVVKAPKCPDTQMSSTFPSPRPPTQRAATPLVCLCSVDLGTAVGAHTWMCGTVAAVAVGVRVV
jgi:hypothetical protein